MRLVPSLARVAAVLLIACSPIIGCGSGSGGNTAHLQGNVTIGGQPLPADAQGSITFNASQQNQAKSVTVPISGGAYDSPETPKGAVKVSFNITQPTGPERTSERGTTYRDLKSLVPDKYAAGMDLEVTDDNSSQNFDL